MGKRGPKADQEFGDQKVVLSTRIAQETRDALQRAANASGRPISREVEHRLRRSFEDDEKIVQTLGGPQMYAMLRTVAASMTFAASGSDDWLNDPDAYDRAFWATIKVLDALRPPGPIAPGSDWADRRKRYGIGFASVILEEVAKAPPILASPEEKLHPPQRLYRRIASDLGEMHGRIAKVKP